MPNSIQIFKTKRTGLRALLRSLGLAFLFLDLASGAFAQCSNPANAIVAENCRPGNPQSEWDLTAPDGDPTLQGFATDISVNKGSTVSFKINSTASAYTINIYRMGYYGGMGARKVATITPSAHLPQSQPDCITDASVGLADCGNWAVSAYWQVPATATSGIYFARLARPDTGGNSHIVFIVRDDSSHSDVLYQTSDETWQAYNYYGLGSLYGPAWAGFDLYTRSYKVSYNRPITIRGFQAEGDTWVFGPEFPMVQWLEQNGYDVTYFTAVDAARSGSLISNHHLYMNSGHDEYWSSQRRANVEAARDAGVNMAFFSGNTLFWKTRWENSIDGTNTNYKTLVCYKETLAFAKLDPLDPPTWTGTWRDPSFSPPADGGKPENSLLGTLFTVNGPGPDNDGLQIKIPAADGGMRFWRNTAVASLGTNQTYSLPVGTLGYEWDEDIDNGFRPAGAFRLSTASYDMTANRLLDQGATYGAGTATHHLMMYRAPSGALVFSSGTVNWSWGLNSNHDNPFDYDTPDPDPNMQQATVNLFADMGVQPATLQLGLVPAIASTDSAPPVSTITSPATNATLNAGNIITVTGTATDSGGGTVAGVEVSGDGGATWHPSTGRSNWSFSWSPTTAGTVTILSRAVDDSGNIEAPHGITVTVVPRSCPCSIWGSSTTPQNQDNEDPGSVELGLKFRADADGSILGVRFYKAPTNTGTHVGHLWSETGVLLGTVNFSSESASGWQQANFSSPIAVTANSTYTVSYFAPNGHYSSDGNYLAEAGVDAPPLHALANGVDGANGVYNYTNTPGVFPTQSYISSNYWVDVVFTSSNTYNVSGTVTGPGGSGATVSVTGTQSLSTAADASGHYVLDGLPNGTYTVVPSRPGVSFSPSSRLVTINGTGLIGVNFTATVTNPQTISGTISGTSGTNVTVTLSGASTALATTDSGGNYSFTGLLNGGYTTEPAAAGLLFTPSVQQVVLSGSGASNVNFQAQVCTCLSIWPAATTPTLIDSNDGAGVELGVAFTSTSPGYITGIRFYKANANSGQHVGHLWTSTGTQLGTVTFSEETVSGWQQASFATPVAITPNVTYIASYLAPAGHYSADSNYFASAGTDSPPLHALANAYTPNGVYAYTSSSSGAFPSNSYSSTNYWVDVLFQPAQSYAITGTISNGASATVSLSSTAGTVTTTADSSGNYSLSGIFPGSYTVTPSKAGAAFVPGSQTVTVGSASVSGVNFSESQLCPCGSIWQTSVVPSSGDVDSGDSTSVETGVKFTADDDGYIVGVRFYKAAGNTGTHKGTLWSTNGNTGIVLATAPFTSESNAGWQQAMFANPVPISGNVPYVASYFAPQGHYSRSASFFAGVGVDTPPLHALADGVSGPNGVFAYGSDSTYPFSTYASTNYWVDVIYAHPATHTIGGTVTGNGAFGSTVNLSGAVNTTTTVDESGNYSFSGLLDGTYTISLSTTLAGSSSIPASQTIALNGKHALGVNFTVSQPTYRISGTVSGAPGDAVVLSGSALATTTADSLGNYVFTGVTNGNYTVTPGSVGLSVSPASQNVTVNGANISAANFSATPLTYSIDGTVSGGAGATVTLGGAVTATTTADSLGNYSFAGLTNGSYTLTPSRVGMVFVPTSAAVSIFGASITGANFGVPSNCPCNTIWQPSAQPLLIDGGDGQPTEPGVTFRADADGYIAGVRFYKAPANTGQHRGNLWSNTGALLAQGNFSNESASGWQQVLFTTAVPITANTPYVASYFTPTGYYSADSQSFAAAGVDTPPLHAIQSGSGGLNGVYTYASTSASSAFPNQSFNAANYWVDVIYIPTSTYSITGTITGPGAAGATVNLSGSSTATTVSDNSGKFSFSGLANGGYTISIATSAGYSYAPATRTVTIQNGHVLGLSFAGQVSYTITGTISGAGGANAMVNLTGTATATVTANSSGVYSFIGLANGSYTVTAIKTGYTFTPASQTITVNGANATANFSSAALTYTITGTISGPGGANATVNLTGAATATVTANSSGVYSFTGRTNGTYTVTPSKTRYTFTPASQTITVNGANATANFSSAVQTYTITGTISGAGGANATVKLTGAATATVTANSSGVYSFTGLPNGSYTVTPSKSGRVFIPSSRSTTINSSNVTGLNFVSL